MLISVRFNTHVISSVTLVHLATTMAPTNQDAKHPTANPTTKTTSFCVGDDVYELKALSDVPLHLKKKLAAIDANLVFDQSHMWIRRTRMYSETMCEAMWSTFAVRKAALQQLKHHVSLLDARAQGCVQAYCNGQKASVPDDVMAALCELDTIRGAYSGARTQAQLLAIM